MNITTQLETFLIFYIYGIIQYVIYYILKRMTKAIWIISVVFPITTILFMIYLYFHNNGQIHIYFFLMMIIGIMTSKVYVKKAISGIKLLKQHKSK